MNKERRVYISDTPRLSNEVCHCFIVVDGYDSAFSRVSIAFSPLELCGMTCWEVENGL